MRRREREGWSVQGNIGGELKKGLWRLMLIIDATFIPIREKEKFNLGEFYIYSFA